MDLRQRRRGTRRRGCDHPSADPTDRGPGRRSAVRRGLPGERSDGGRLAPPQRGATSHRVGTASAAGAARLVGAQGGRRGGPPGGLRLNPDDPAELSGVPAALDGTSLISAPFEHGLTIAFYFAIAACLIAAVASLLRGGKYVHDTHAVPIAGAAEDAATRLASAHGSATAASVPAVAGESAAGAQGGRERLAPAPRSA